MNKTWDKIISYRNVDKRVQGGNNDLKDDEIVTILTLVDFWGDEYEYDLISLRESRLPVYSWLANRARDADQPISTKVLVHSFMKVDGDVDKFIKDLRNTDYDVDVGWKDIELPKRPKKS